MGDYLFLSITQVMKQDISLIVSTYYLTPRGGTLYAWCLEHTKTGLARHPVKGMYRGELKELSGLCSLSGCPCVPLGGYRALI